MKALFVKDLASLRPASQEAEEVLTKIKRGDLVMVEVKRSRNLKHHQKFFVLMHLVFDNQEKYEVFEDFLDAVKCATGHRTILSVTESRIIMQPKSIAFSKMDQDQFNAFYNNVIDLVCRKIIPGMDREELIAQVEELIY